MASKINLAGTGRYLHAYDGIVGYSRYGDSFNFSDRMTPADARALAAALVQSAEDAEAQAERIAVQRAEAAAAAVAAGVAYVDVPF